MRKAISFKYAVLVILLMGSLSLMCLKSNLDKPLDTQFTWSGHICCSSQPRPQYPPKQTLNTTSWKTFVSKNGWSIKYPSTWHMSSCTSCSDLTIEGEVDFFPPGNQINIDEGWVKFSYPYDFQEKSADNSMDDVVLKTTGGTPRIEQKILFQNLPAIRFVYYSDFYKTGGGMWEDVTISNNKQIAEINFIDDKIGGTLDNAKNYPTYLAMLQSLKFLK